MKTFALTALASLITVAALSPSFADDDRQRFRPFVQHVDDDDDDNDDRPRWVNRGWGDDDRDHRRFWHADRDDDNDNDDNRRWSRDDDDNDDD